MHTLLLYIMLVSAHTLHAASLEPHLFGYYKPPQVTTIGIHCYHNRDAKKLSLSLIDMTTHKPQSDAVTLWGNRIYPTSTSHSQTRLSLIACTQYPTSTINGRFLALPCHPHRLVSVSSIIWEKDIYQSITSIQDCMEILATQKYAHPVLIVDIAAWLTCCFGPEWRLQLPIYYHEGELLTKAEYDVLFPTRLLCTKKKR